MEKWTVGKLANSLSCPEGPCGKAIGLTKRKELERGGMDRGGEVYRRHFVAKLPGGVIRRGSMGVGE